MKTATTTAGDRADDERQKRSRTARLPPSPSGLSPAHSVPKSFTVPSLTTGWQTEQGQRPQNPSYRCLASYTIRRWSVRFIPQLNLNHASDDPFLLLRT